MDLLETLRQFWGYKSFRPLQEQIVHSLLDGHDACVVMPTGGGKSLCYQLPAVISAGKTVIVISPLIALMQDQVAQLVQMGIPCAVLNSSLPAAEQARVMREASEGRYRLLYLSPERIAREDSMRWLQRVPVSFFVIDEAHCISEWGHEFRPDYRQLSGLRVNFPDLPIAAFTASATRQVRHDIIEQLNLRDPHRYIVSFHRPNLRYVIRRCDSGTQRGLLVRALRKYEGQSVIVYAPTIRGVDEMVDYLAEAGIPAVPYHSKMDSETRRRNQESWMSDETRVLVGTIAFGLGINKTSVRAVIHLSLPKSIEQYYQEAGRAGRDGQPADCLLLWQGRDVGLLVHFIGQISDPEEKERAWQRYHTLKRFAESKTCRHRQICLHFGEKPKWASCGACDVCGATPEWLLAPLDEEVRPRRRRGRSRPSVAALTPPRVSAQVSGREPAVRVDGVDVDAELREYLREWRRTTASKQGVPAFIVMHDSSLEELCRVRPRSLSELLGVPGFGERKTETYGPQILEALRHFQGGARAMAAQKPKEKPADETKRLLAEGHTFAEIANLRDRQPGTVVDMVCKLVERDELEFQPAWIGPGKFEQIEAACARLGMGRLQPLKDALPRDISFEEIRLVLSVLRHRNQKK
ncbi:MAG TPA: RecQ family ATP-dependent DNA helicase [Terriglobia bacterium]|nr:RecQ family ATP-dependent DNA helicase [Terriglobia bacterium]